MTAKLGGAHVIVTAHEVAGREDLERAVEIVTRLLTDFDNRLSRELAAMPGMFGVRVILDDQDEPAAPLKFPEPPRYDEVTTGALRELDVSREIVLALAPLSPRMRAAVLEFATQKSIDREELAKADREAAVRPADFTKNTGGKP